MTKKKFGVSINETTDTEGRFIANVIIGTLIVDRPSDMLLNSEELEKANHSTFRMIFEPLKFLWPESVKYDDVLLFVTDDMVKAGKAILNLNTKMIHVPCSAHGLHRVTVEVRN